MRHRPNEEQRLSDLYEVKYFTDEFDRLADEADPDLWAYRRERHLAAVLHIQVQQFFMGLEAALAPRITDPLSGGRLLQLGLSVAEELKLEPDEGDPDLLDQFAYMHALADAIPFDATYDVGFAPDGTISILVGPDLPPFPEVGICGSQEHDGRDLQTAIVIACSCTRLAARLGAQLRYGSHEEPSATIDTTRVPAAETTLDSVQDHPLEGELLGEILNSGPEEKAQGYARVESGMDL